MTKEEILLFERIIELAVRKAVNEAVSSEIKKELSDIKKLTARLLKESREARSEPLNESTRTISRTSADVNTFKRAAPPPMPTNIKGQEHTFPQAKTSPVAPYQQQYAMPEAQAAHYANSETLPDIDAPIFFDPNSIQMQQFRDKLVNNK